MRVRRPSGRLAGRLGGRRTSRGAKLIIAAVMAVAGLFTYYGSKQKNPITGRTQAIAFTQEQEVALGLESAPQMARKFGGLEEGSSRAALVKQVGERIVRRSAASETPYRFQFNLLKDDRTVNAFALPGGPIFITRGLLDRLGTEAELAGVLGHEVGHVVGRHAAERIAKGQLGQALVGAVSIATSDESGRRNAAAQMAGQVVAKMVLLKYGREDELQSDSLGVRFMTDAGYDPQALIRVMEVLAEAGGGRKRAEFTSSHPDPGNRSERIREQIAKAYPGGVPEGLTQGRKLGRAD